jgi:16S rRNA (uracil1498-N3)-methyltransferase
MHRFYLPPNECKGATLLLTGSEAHHAARVLRVQRGERVIVLDGAGNEFLCDVENVGRNELQLAIAERKSIHPLPFQIALLQAVPKGKIFESIIQKATELGAHRIVPLLTERVATHLDDERATSKTPKWQHVAVEAVKQCGAAWLPRVDPPVTPKEFLSGKEKFELPLIGSLQSERKHPREYFRAFQAEHQRMPKSVCIWIGPEGDFSPAEVAMIQSAGALPITLGRLVLRVETAAIYCLSILNYELQSEKGSTL